MSSIAIPIEFTDKYDEEISYQLSERYNELHNLIIVKFNDVTKVWYYINTAIIIYTNNFFKKGNWQYSRVGETRW